MKKNKLMKEFFKLIMFNKKVVNDFNKLVDDYNELKADNGIVKHYEIQFEEFKDEFTNKFSDFVDVIFKELEQEEKEHKGEN